MSDTLAKVQSTPVPSVARMAATSVGAAPGSARERDRAAACRSRLTVTRPTHSG